MAQSLSKLFVHIIFHIKNPDAFIRREEKEELYAYIGSIIKDCVKKYFAVKAGRGNQKT